VDGDLVLLPKDLQYQLFKQLDADLSAVKHHKIVFMAPLPRYYNKSCCDDPDHVGNIKNEDYKRKMEDGVYSARTNIKNFAFRHGFRNSVTVSSWGQVKKLSDLWANQVLLTAAGYDVLAGAICEAGKEIERKRKGSASETEPARKKAKTGGDMDTRRGGSRGSRGGQSIGVKRCFIFYTLLFSQCEQRKKTNLNLEARKPLRCRLS
jgi:hypothetical protein